MDQLLLDSARPISVDASNCGFGRPGENSEGDLKSCIEPNQVSDNDIYRWYVLRITYSRELKVSEQLAKIGIRTFVPMMWKKVEVKGRAERRKVPAINNLCFVYWSRKEIREYIETSGENSFVHFYWDHTAGHPLYVSDKAMNDFIKVASAVDDEDILYLENVSEKFRAGQHVTITAGPFEGVTGKVVRVKKSRRVLVEVPGVLAVVTAFVHPRDLMIKTDN